MEGIALTIEFRCTRCNKLLRTPPGTEGKQAKCPQCGAMMAIPAASIAEVPPRDADFDPAATASHHGQANPYQSPAAAASFESPFGSSAVGFHPTRVVLTDVLEQTWNIFKSNLLVCILGALIGNICMQIAHVLFGGLVSAITDNTTWPVAVVGGLFGGLGAVAIDAYFLFGMAKFFLGIARHGRADWADFFSIGPLLVPATAILALLILGMIGGFMLLFVPGVLFLMYFGLAPFMLIDQRSDVMDSFRLSARVMEGNKATVLLMSLIVFFAGLALTVATCGLGVFLFSPFVLLLYAVTYLGVSGQPTSARRPVASTAERPLFSPGVQPHG